MGEQNRTNGCAGTQDTVVWQVKSQSKKESPVGKSCEDLPPIFGSWRGQGINFPMLCLSTTPPPKKKKKKKVAYTLGILELTLCCMQSTLSFTMLMGQWSQNLLFLCRKLTAGARSCTLLHWHPWSNHSILLLIGTRMENTFILLTLAAWKFIECLLIIWPK